MKGLGGAVFLVFVVGAVFGIGYLALGTITDRNSSLVRQIEQERLSLSNLSSKIDQLNASDETAVFPKEMSIFAGDELDAELKLQKAVLSLADQKSISPLAFGPSGSVSDVTLKTVSFELEFEAGYSSALNFLSEIEAIVPPIAFQNLSVRQLPAGALEDIETPVYVQTLLWSFWDPQTGEN